MRLTVTADDYGLTPATSRAILTAHRDGIVTRTSVLVLGSGFATSAGWLTEVDGLSVGVHLAVVGEDPPLLSAAEIPTLVDRRGRLADGWRHLLPRLLARGVDPDDLRREMRAQLDAVRSAGLAPTHLDTHQHLHLWPTVATVVVDLAEAEGIPSVRVPDDRRGVRGRAVQQLCRRLRRQVEARGLATTDTFAGLHRAGGLDRAALAKELRWLAERGAPTAELAVHPGAVEDPDRARYRWGYGWAAEREALCDPATHRLVADLGFTLARDGA